MPEKNNGKVSVKMLYEEIMPIVKGIAEHTTEITNMKEDIKEIKNCYRDITTNSISKRAFGFWLTALASAVGIAIGLLSRLG